jgi:protein-disulfide isomerase
MLIPSVEIVLNDLNWVLRHAPILSQTATLSAKAVHQARCAACIIEAGFGSA